MIPPYRTTLSIREGEQPYYRIYLLTVWQERTRGPPEGITWHFRLEDPRTGCQQVFAKAATFMTALQHLTISEQGAKENIMTTTESRAFIQQYLAALSGKAKPLALVKHYATAWRARLSPSGFAVTLVSRLFCSVLASFPTDSYVDKGVNK
jgi:hypothetical protein